MVRRLSRLSVAVACALVATAQPASADRRLNDVRPAAPAKQVCTRVIAGSTSFEDVRIVGAIAQGKLRKILVLVAGRGSIVLPGECVGRERVPFDRILERVVPWNQPTPAPQPLPPNVA